MKKNETKRFFIRTMDIIRQQYIIFIYGCTCMNLIKERFNIQVTFYLFTKEFNFEFNEYKILCMPLQ